MSGMVSQIEEILARAEKLPGKTDEADEGFGAAGEGQTQQGDPAAPDKQTDGGFSAAGPGVTKKNDPGNPAEGFFAAGIPGITTPLASPDSGGFSSAGSGATSHSDPTAGNEGTSGNRDARPPAASVGTPPSGSTPIIVRPQPFRGDGQPAAVHIFGATSRMGWAGGLAQYSVGPADQSIVEHLMTAGEHVMWANKMSFPPTPAWPGWSEKRSWLQSQANELARNRTNDYRRRIAGSMSGNYGAMCSELSVQTFGTTQQAPNCDAYYCRLGFLMARGQQALLIADEANNNRDKQITNKARADGLSHLSQAVQVLSDYEQVLAVSGRCADLRDVKQMLMNIIRGGNIPDQARAATAAWQTALERIAALGQGGPPQPGKYEECLKKYCPECLETIDLLGVAKDQKCNDCKRKNEKLINECVAGTPSPVGRPVPPQPAPPGTIRDPRPNVSTELEGVWTEWIVLRYEGRGYRFSLQSGGDVSDERKFFFETKDRDDLRELLRKITASAKDMTNININPRRRITVEFLKSGGRYSGRVTQGTISLDDSLFGRHIGSKLSPGTEVFKFNRVAEDEYTGDYLDRSFGNRWIGGNGFIVLGDFAVEKLRNVIIWKRVR